MCKQGFVSAHFLHVLFKTLPIMKGGERVYVAHVQLLPAASLTSCKGFMGINKVTERHVNKNEVKHEYH